jgi:hypothetical protein
VQKTADKNILSRDIMPFKKIKEVMMAKRAGAFKSEKRRKELARQKKQEEKRQRRISKKESPDQGEEITYEENKDEENKD